MFLTSTNSITEPVIAIMGQAEFTTLVNAQDYTFGDMALGGLPGAELKPLFKLIFRTSTGYANNIKAYIEDIQDLRALDQVPSGNFIATDHQSLSGRGAAGAHPGTAVSYDPTASGLAAIEVQAALDEIALIGSPKVIEVPFAFGDVPGTVDSTAVVPANAWVLKTQLLVETLFSGGANPAAAVSVNGTAPTSLMLTSENDLEVANQYEVEDLIEVTAGNGGVVRITLTGTAGAGAGRVFVTYVTPLA
jgi:hypothetical protein